MTTLTVIGSVKAKPGKADVLRDVLKEMVLPTLAEEGCLRYELSEAEDGQSWMFSELWESRALWDRHIASQHVASYRAVAGDLVEQGSLFRGHMIRPGA